MLTKIEPSKSKSCALLVLPQAALPPQVPKQAKPRLGRELACPVGPSPHLDALSLLSRLLGPQPVPSPSKASRTGNISAHLLENFRIK